MTANRWTAEGKRIGIHVKTSHLYKGDIVVCWCDSITQLLTSQVLLSTAHRHWSNRRGCRVTHFLLVNLLYGPDTRQAMSPLLHLFQTERVRTSCESYCCKVTLWSVLWDFVQVHIVQQSVGAGYLTSLLTLVPTEICLLQRVSKPVKYQKLASDTFVLLILW